MTLVGLFEQGLCSDSAGDTCSPGDQAVGEGSVDGCVFARACVCKGKDVAASWYMHLALGLKSDSFLDTGNFYGQERQMHTQSTNTQKTAFSRSSNEQPTSASLPS